MIGEGEVRTRAQLRADGLSDSTISRQARRGQAARVLRGAYAASPDPELAAIVRALAPGVALSHLTAARAWGLPVDDDSADHVLVRHGGHHRSLPTAVRVHQSRSWQVVEIERVPVTEPLRTVLDVARVEPRRFSLPILDAALAAGLVTDPALRNAAASARGLGAGRVRSAVALADGRAESPLESMLRLILVEAGLPPDDLQHVVRERGRFVARVDMWYEGVIVEADGFEHHRARADYRADRRKGQAFARLGLLVLRFSWEDVVLHPDAVVRSVAAAVQRVAA